MKVLFIGGTGRISTACTQLAAERGIELYILNRGQTERYVPGTVTRLNADVRDKYSVVHALGRHVFDVVVNWIAYLPEHIETDLDIFKERTNQYVFISSASVYTRPPSILPITESSPCNNYLWEYSINKIACEKRLIKAYDELGFPITIVRPSHTYDNATIPVHGRYTVIHRMLEGKEVIVHGDGTSLWVLTHSNDFAKGLIGLLGNKQTIGETFQITSNEIHTWNQVYEILAQASGTKANLVHIPSEYIALFDQEWGASLLGDKAHSVFFDNSKIKRIVPSYRANISFAEGAEQILLWYNKDKSRQIIDTDLSQLMDRIISTYKTVWPKRLINYGLQRNSYEQAE